MASVKRLATIAIVNPKDPQDPKPRIANIDDVKRNGWTLWADRHAPLVDPSMADKPAEPGNDGEDKPADTGAGAEGSDAADESGNKPGANPSEVKKGPGQKGK